MSERAGVTLAEVLVVVAIGIILMIPTTNFLISSMRFSQQGFDRLDNLTAARIILEKCARDLKFLCGNASFSTILVQTEGKARRYIFPVFPNEGSGVELRSSVNPVNLVAYAFDPVKQTLSRSIITHPLMSAANQGFRQHDLAGKVVDFQINTFPLWGSFFQIRVSCKGPNPQREELIELQTSVRSLFCNRALQHFFQIPNLDSAPELPPAVVK